MDRPLRAQVPESREESRGGVAVVSGLEGMVVLVWESSLRKGSPELRPAWGGIAVS